VEGVDPDPDPKLKEGVGTVSAELGVGVVDAG